MEEKEILIDNLKINYKIAGSGPAILILPGWGSNSDKWERVGDLIAKLRFKVVIPDLPGFGNSQKPSFAWGLDNFCYFVEKFSLISNLEKFYLLGHSFGGAVAVKCCLKFPQKIEKLFLVSPACFRRKTLRKRLFYIAAKILKIFSFSPFYFQLRNFFYKFILKSNYLETEGVMKNSYLKIIDEDLSDILDKIKVPTIIIWGEKDKITKIREGYLINKKIKNSRLEILPKIGHRPHLEIPEKLSEIILNSLN